MKELFEREISIYESLFDVDSSHTITVGQALNRIKKGKSKDKVDRIDESLQCIYSSYTRINSKPIRIKKKFNNLSIASCKI